MAVLEKIRSKSVLLFTIIIVALLAFILGDFLNSGCSRRGDTVAEAAGVKVKYDQYNTTREQNSELFKQQLAMARQQNPYLPGVNEDEVSEYTIFSLLSQGLLDEEFDRLGIEVTDQELSAFNLDPKNNAMVMSMFAQKLGADPTALAQMGLANVNSILDALKNPKQYQLDERSQQMFENAWKNYEDELAIQLKRKLYMDLLGGLFTANKIDARNTYDERNTSISFQYVNADLASIADDKVKLTDADYEKVYNEYKGQFRIYEPKRFINYITANIAPSDADRTKMDATANKLIADLNTLGGDSAMAKNNTFTHQTVTLTRENLSRFDDVRTLAANIDSMAVGSAKQTLALGNHYAIAKLLEKGTGIDSVSCYLIPVENVSKLDSVAATYTVANIDSLAANAKLETSLINPSIQGMTDRIKAQLENAPLNQIVTFVDTIQTQQGKTPMGFVFNVTKRSLPVTTYTLLVATADLTPSDATISEISQKLHNYIANNSTAADFEKNATKAGYNVGKALVSASDPIGFAAPNSMVAVRWAMVDAKVGQVSNVFSLNLPEAQNGTSQYFLAVAVAEDYDDDFIPANSQYAKEVLKPICMRNKKAEMLATQYKGQAGSLESLASALKTQVNTANSSFGANAVAGSANANVLAAIATAKPGTVTGPITGDNGVFYIKVQNRKTEGRPYDFRENANTFLGRVLNSFVEQTIKGEIVPSFQLLKGDDEIENNILQFTRAE